MTIFSDAAGFKYFGDCQWGTLNIDYPTQYYFEATPTHVVDAAKPGISACLTNLCTSAGLSFRNVASQADFDARIGTNVGAFNFLWFGPNGDIDDRYSFSIGVSNGTGSGQYAIQIYNDLGSTGTSNTATTDNSTNRLYILNRAGINYTPNIIVAFGTASSTASPVYWCGASDGTYLALFLYRRNWLANTAYSSFYYAGLFDSVNTNFNYYSANNTSKTLVLQSSNVLTISDPIVGAHYIATTPKLTFQTNTLRSWHGITTQGSNLYACVRGGDIYKQIAGTKGWTPLNQTARNWTSMTTLGNNVYAAVDGGDIYRQINGTGDFLPLGQTSRAWYGMTTLGNNVYASVNSGDIYMQTNGTGNFVALGQTARQWLAMTTLGTDVYACAHAGDIYKQTNGTGNFVALSAGNRNWFAMGTLGTSVYAGVGSGDIYTQTNGTGAFVALGQTNRQWRGLASLGTDMYATVSDGDIYKQTNGVGGFIGEQFNPAQYPIVCADSQSPTSQWVTDAYIFDNNQTLQYPAMGKGRGLLLGTGTYTLGKPVKIQGSVFPDGGSPWYLPVGTYAGKTLLMRCYSSMT